MQPAASVLGISEIVLNVSDLPTMREFYQRVMGFRLHSESCHVAGPEADVTGEPTISFLTIVATNTPLGRNLHPQFLVLIDRSRHYSARQRFVGHDVSRSTLNHLAFEIAPQCFEDHQQRLESLGLHPTVSEFPALQARALFFRDPEGNVLELISAHPAG
jgi:catechol-2,3-dioxygenase